ncbi:MAG TPA: glycosyltransferase family 4 protein [Geminicoccaceae bacterium]
MLSGAPGPATVLMTTDTIGGIWTYALDLAGGLRRRGVRTVLASMGPPPTGTQRAAALSIPDLVLEQSTFLLEWMDHAEWDVRRAGEWLLELELVHLPEVVHVNGFAHAALPFAAPTVCVAHSCVGTWWRAVKGEAPPARFAGYLGAVAAGLDAADGVVAPTRAFLDQLETVYGPRPRARVIPNGRSAAGFGSSRKRDMVFSAGRGWDEAKNVIALDAIAADLDWPVVVAGDWRPPRGEAEPPRHLLCLDLVEPEQLRQWLADAPIFALPARYEPFGLAPLEAALSGCALVLGDLPTLREVWGEAALYVPPDDRAALRATLQALIRDPARRRRMARAAEKRARRFGAVRMAEGYLSLYRGLRRCRALTHAALPPAASAA